MSSEEDELDLDSLNISAKKEDGIARVYVLHCICAVGCGPLFYPQYIFYLFCIPFSAASSEHGAT